MVRVSGLPDALDLGRDGGDRGGPAVFIGWSQTRTGGRAGLNEHASGGSISDIAKNSQSFYVRVRDLGLTCPRPQLNGQLDANSAGPAASWEVAGCRIGGAVATTAAPA
jgi:hypothetical protein